MTKKKVRKIFSAMFVLVIAFTASVFFVGCSARDNALSRRIAAAQFVPDLNALMPSLECEEAFNQMANSSEFTIDNLGAASVQNSAFDTTELTPIPFADIKENRSSSSGDARIRSAEQRIEDLINISREDQALAVEFARSNYGRPNEWHRLLRENEFYRYERFTRFPIASAQGLYYITVQDDIVVLFSFVGVNPENTLKKRIVVSSDGDTVEIFTDHNNASFWVDDGRGANWTSHIPYMKNVRNTHLFVVEESKGITFVSHPDDAIIIGEDEARILKSVRITDYKRTGDSFEGKEIHFSFDNIHNLTEFEDLKLTQTHISFTEGNPFIYNTMAATIRASGMVQYSIEVSGGGYGRNFVAILTDHGYAKQLGAQFSLNHFDGIETFFVLENPNDVDWIQAIEVVSGDIHEWVGVENTWFNAGINLTSWGALNNWANYNLSIGMVEFLAFDNLSEVFFAGYSLPSGVTVNLPSNFEDLNNAAEIVAEKSLLGIDNLAYNYELVLAAIRRYFIEGRFVEW